MHTTIPRILNFLTEIGRAVSSDHIVSMNLRLFTVWGLPGQNSPSGGVVSELRGRLPAILLQESEAEAESWEGRLTAYGLAAR